MIFNYYAPYFSESHLVVQVSYLSTLFNTLSHFYELQPFSIVVAKGARGLVWIGFEVKIHPIQS
jgi:hypothetical protein